MESGQKLEIFDKYDFGKNAELKRAGIEWNDPRSPVYHGMASILQGIDNGKDLIFSPEDDGKLEQFLDGQSQIYESYGWVQSKYQTINWNALDPKDPDFGIFYEMRDLIKELGVSIDVFLEKSRPSLSNTYESEESKEMCNIFRKMRDMTIRYRTIKARLRKGLGLGPEFPGLEFLRAKI